MALKLSLLQVLFILLVSIAPHVITARDLIHIHKHKPSQLRFHQHDLEGSRNGDNIKGIHDVKLYLQRYGYLTAANVETNNNPNAFDDELESALKTFQKNYNLNVSGTLDKETLGLMSRARCGVPDNMLRSNNNNNNNNSDDMNFHSHFRFFAGGPKWPVTKFNLTYAFMKSFPTVFITPVLNAMEQWRLNSKFTFTASARPLSADIKVSFEKGNHGDNFPFTKGVSLAHAFGPLDGRVHFNLEQSWTVGEVDGWFNVETVALHELGHVLGLGHTTIQQAIMWPYIDAGAFKSLQFDDIEGIQTLYG